MIRIQTSLALPALLACALFQLPLTLPAAPVSDDPVVATGKGFEIKRSQLNDAYIDYSSSAVSAGRPIPDAQRNFVRAKLLDRLIINKILIPTATADDSNTVAQSVDRQIAMARSNAPSQEAFDQKVKATGMSLDALREKMRQQELSRRLIMRVATNGVVISDADVKKFYDDNPSQFQTPEQVRAAHILVSTQDPITHQPLPPDVKKEKLKLANEIKARAEKGEDFAALARQYSDDPGSKNSGGEYTFPRGKMVPEFEAAAFSMKTNQISDPVETQFGYHIIKLIAKLPATTGDFAKAAPDIRAYLTEHAAETSLPDRLEKLKAAADIKVLDPELAAELAKPASIPPAAPAPATPKLPPATNPPTAK
jgi:peptidyl-prolyl cis-trans isomerase C